MSHRSLKPNPNPTVAEMRIAIAEFEANYFAAEARRSRRVAQSLKRSRQESASFGQFNNVARAAEAPAPYGRPKLKTTGRRRKASSPATSPPRTVSCK